MTGLYQIRNIINNKIYVGSSVDIMKRLTAHKRLLRINKHHSVKLQVAWNKYGEESFEFTVIQEVDAEALKLEEQLLLDSVFVDPTTCYNISIDASAPMRGRKMPVHTIEKRRGISHSEESNRKRSETILKLYQDEEFKQKHLERVSCESAKKNMSNGQTVRFLNLENRVMAAEKTRAFFADPENRAKQAERTRRFCANNPNRKPPSKKLSDSDTEYIINHYKPGISKLVDAKEIAIKCNVSWNTVYRVIRKHKWQLTVQRNSDKLITGAVATQI